MKRYYGGPIGTHQRSFEQYHPRPSMASPSPTTTQNCNRYYLRNGQSYGLQVWQIHSQGPSEQKRIKILEKRERGRIQGLPKFFEYLVLSHGRVKLHISNLAGTFTGFIQTKAH